MNYLSSTTARMALPRLRRSLAVVFDGVKSLPAIVSIVTGPHQILSKTVPPFSGAPLGNWSQVR